jgi:hypothetical protein
VRTRVPTAEKCIGNTHALTWCQALKEIHPWATLSKKNAFGSGLMSLILFTRQTNKQTNKQQNVARSNAVCRSATIATVKLTKRVQLGRPRR